MVPMFEAPNSEQVRREGSAWSRGACDAFDSRLASWVGSGQEDRAETNRCGPSCRQMLSDEFGYAIPYVNFIKAPS